MNNREAELSALARSPDVDPTRLLQLAANWPEEVLANPLLPLLALEDPNLYQSVLRRVGDGLVCLTQTEVTDLRPPERRRFALMCCADVLPFLEAAHSGDSRPRKVLDWISISEEPDHPLLLPARALLESLPTPISGSAYHAYRAFARATLGTSSLYIYIEALNCYPEGAPSRFLAKKRYLDQLRSIPQSLRERVSRST